MALFSWSQSVLGEVSSRQLLFSNLDCRLAWKSVFTSFSGGHFPFLVSVWSAAYVGSAQDNGRYDIQRKASLWCEWRPWVHACAQGHSQWGANIWTEDASGCFKSVLLVEDSFGDDKLPQTAKLQEQAPVVVVVINAVYANYSLPWICILAHSSTEITKDFHFLVCGGALETAAELRVELVFFCRFSLKGWSVHTEKIIFQRKAHWLHAAVMTGWQIFQSGGSGGAHHETNSWKGPLSCWFPWPEEGVFGFLFLGMSTFKQDSSRAIRAEWCPGRLLWPTSSMVLMFQHATLSIFALFEVSAYIPSFNVLGPLEKMLVDRGKPTGGWETSCDKATFSRPLFLGSKQCCP